MIASKPMLRKTSNLTNYLNGIGMFMMAGKLVSKKQKKRQPQICDKNAALRKPKL